MPQLSVVVTCFNHERYIAQALDSVFAQSLPPDEVIVIDDASSDQSAAIVQTVAERAPIPMQRVLRERNLGQASALNEGIRRSSGDIVALLDGDDTWRPDKLEAMVAFMDAHPGGGVYQHQVDNLDDLPYRPIVVSGELYSLWAMFGTVNCAVHPEWVKLNLPTSALVFTRDVLEAILPIPVTLRACPDFYLFTLGASEGPVYTNPSILGAWRIHHTNASHRSAFSFPDYWRDTIFPEVNSAFADRGLPVRFTFYRWGVFWEPIRLIRAAWRRRQLRRRGARVD